MDLFDSNLKEQLKSTAPLAVRMRPRTLEEFAGQEEIIGQGTALRQAIQEDKLGSVILYGPPGSGKTSLAKIIANLTKAEWEQLSAVMSGVADIRRVIDQARERLAYFSKRTILFIDEIHRFNKSQQDALLPAVEEGIVTLIGATTENPYFEVNSPLISRSRIFQLKPLQATEIRSIVDRALRDKERGYGNEKVVLDEAVVEHLSDLANGDARVALNALEMAVETTAPDKKQRRVLTLKKVSDALQKRALLYDKTGDVHYDTISAFIKSLRGSDPDAALYYLARMIYGGEDPRFIVRRMVIFASEDIGNADPQALVITTAAAQAVEFVGLPECRLNLAQAAVYLATAPKSNSVIKAIDSALADVEKEITPPVPKHLRDSSYPGAKKFGHGEGYLYPHNFPGHHVKQEYLPGEKKGRKYYHPSNAGCERTIADFLNNIRKSGDGDSVGDGEGKGKGKGKGKERAVTGD